VSNRLDVLRSLVRSAATAAKSGLGRVPSVAAVRRVMSELKSKRAIVRDEALTALVVRAPGVAHASVTSRDGRIVVDATFDDGDRTVVSFVPAGASFAPRGAKEIAFRVEPAELASERRVSDLAGSIAAGIAFGLWGPLLGKDARAKPWAIADRDGDSLRIDLRTIPAVRSATGRGPFAMILDVIEIGSIAAEDGAVTLEVRMPMLEMMRRSQTNHGSEGNPNDRGA